MSAQPLPDRPNLDQLKRRAKELLKAWKSAPASHGTTIRLRDAQQAIAREHGFASWDALRRHIEQLTGATGRSHHERRGLDYDNPIRGATLVKGPLTNDLARRLAEQGVTAVKLDPSVSSGTFIHLAHIPTLRGLDFSGRDDLADRDLAFLERMPWLTEVSLSQSGISDDGVAHLESHQALELVNLRWTSTGDRALAALRGKPALARLTIGNRVTDEGVQYLRDYPALARGIDLDSFLGISSARTLTDRSLAAIGSLAGVAAFDVHTSVFGSPHFTARGVAHLQGMTSLESLNFHGALATDDVLREIAAIPKLRHLHCQDIVSGDDGFVALGRRHTLEALGARFCSRVTDRGFTAICRLPRLKALGAGGRRLTANALAPLADATELIDLGPILFGDAAFAHIARIPNLRQLNNMYNRATTDAATRHLRGHQQLTGYTAFGTQITDESLRILAGVPTLETFVFESCAGITDDGLRELATLPKLRRLTVWDCAQVKGEWTASAATGVETSSELGPPGHAAGYRAETLMDYPDLAMPADVSPPAGEAPAGALSTLACFGVGASFVDKELRLMVEPGADTRWVALVTRHAHRVPLRMTIVVRPITELKLVFGAHNRLLVFDDRGFPDDPAPWFMKPKQETGDVHGTAGAPPLSPEEWATLVVEFDEQERRVIVNGVLRHTMRQDFTGVRSRVAIGVRRAALSVRELTIEPLAAS
jgi:hypothetical protein